MPDDLSWDGEGFLESCYREAAQRLLRAAVLIQVSHKTRVGIANPPPKFLQSSKPGEYPRARTYGGRDSVKYTPDSWEGILAAGLQVRIGYLPNAWYMGWLEIDHRRLGLQQTLSDLRPQLEQLTAMGSYVP